MSKEYTDAELEKIIIDGDLPALKAVLEANPEYLNHRGKDVPESERSSARGYFSDGARLEDGTSLLMRACRRGKTEIAKYLIEQGADVNIKHSVTERTALHYAAESNSLEIARMLLDAGADMYAKRIYTGEMPAHAAAMKDSKDVLELFLDRGFDVNEKAIDSNGSEDSLLSLSIFFALPDEVELLISRGANTSDGFKYPNTARGVDCSALVYAVERDKNPYRDNARILKAIIEAEKKNSFIPANLWSLCWAWRRLSHSEEILKDEEWKDDKRIQKEAEFWLKAIKLLAEAGIKISSGEVEGSEVENKEAHEAIKNSIVKDLKAIPEFIDASWYKEVEGKNAKPENKEAILKLRRAIADNDIALFKATIEAEPKLVNFRAKNSVSVLMVASYFGRAEMVEFLIEKGTNLDQATIKGKSREYIRDKKTALHFAAEAGEAEVVNILVKAGAKMYLKDWYGRTPAHCAAESNKLEAVKEFLSLGFKADTPSGHWSKQTIFDIAKESNSKEVFEFLSSAPSTSISAKANAEQAATQARKI